MTIREVATERSHCHKHYYFCETNSVNPLTPEDFHVFEWFSAFTRPVGFGDSIFKVTIKSAAVLKH